MSARLGRASRAVKKMFVFRSHARNPWRFAGLDQLEVGGHELGQRVDGGGGRITAPGRSPLSWLKSNLSPPTSTTEFVTLPMTTDLLRS
jgi:hypothetical protein